MIESCTKKRMLIVVVSLVGLSLLLLGLESFLTDDHKYADDINNPSNNSKDVCWLTQEFRVIKECHPCSSFDITVKLPFCLPTGFKELVKCAQTNEENWKSCDLPWLEKRNFWIFEGVTFLLGLFSGLITYTRQRQLNRRMLDRIQKQIASGV